MATAETVQQVAPELPFEDRIFDPKRDADSNIELGKVFEAAELLEKVDVRSLLRKLEAMKDPNLVSIETQVTLIHAIRLMNSHNRAKAFPKQP